MTFTFNVQGVTVQGVTIKHSAFPSANCVSLGAYLLPVYADPWPYVLTDDLPAPLLPRLEQWRSRQRGPEIAHEPLPKMAILEFSLLAFLVEKDLTHLVA